MKKERMDQKSFCSRDGRKRAPMLILQMSRRLEKKTNRQPVSMHSKSYRPKGDSELATARTTGSKDRGRHAQDCKGGERSSIHLITREDYTVGGSVNLRPGKNRESRKTGKQCP